MRGYQARVSIEESCGGCGGCSVPGAMCSVGVQKSVQGCGTAEEGVEIWLGL